MEEQKIRLRASSIVSHLACSQKWFKNFIEGKQDKENIRARLGTAIHSSIESYWNNCKQKGSKIDSEEVYKRSIDYGLHTFFNFVEKENKVVSKVPEYEEGFTEKTYIDLIKKASIEYFKHIVPYCEIPIGVEQEMVIPVKNHPYIKELGGTIDILNSNSICDIKTSKRKVDPKKHKIQQSIYKYVAIKNGYDIKDNFLHTIILGKYNVNAEIIKIDTDFDYADYIIKLLLEKLKLYYNNANKDRIADILFPGNPTDYLCSNTFCNYTQECKFYGNKN